MKQDAFSRFHPAVNFVFFLGAIGFGVVVQHPAYLLAGCVLSAAYYLLLRGKKGLRLMLSMLPLAVLLAGINPLFNTAGEQVLFNLFGRPYTLEALYFGMAIAAIFVIMMLWFGCYNAVLTSDKFMGLFGTAAPALSLLLVMVLRMIPNFIKKAGQITGARRSIGKGAGAESTRRERLDSGMTVLSALTDWALEGSVVTADAMRARGYGAAKRTSFRIYRMTGRDWGLLGLMAALAALVLWSGGTAASYTPQFSAAPINFGLAAYCLFLGIPTALQIWEEIQWRILTSRI